MSSIYLASPYHRRGELKCYAWELEYQGHTVTSRWLGGSHDSLVDGIDDVATRGGWAAEDIENIRAADTLLVFPLPASEGGMVTGGVHVEMGIALALGKRIIAVGGRPNVFYCLPQVEVCDDFGGALAALATPQAGGEGQ